jgi:small subunit ribosomal protein S21
MPKRRIRQGRRRLARKHLPNARRFVLHEGIGQTHMGLAAFVLGNEPGATSKGPRARRRLPVEVQVRDNNVDQALRALKKKMQREGLYREMRMRRHYEKPSERRAREKAEAIRRYRKLLRKRRERDEV